MVHASWKKKNRPVTMKKSIILVILCLSLVLPAALLAGEAKPDPNVSYGFGVTGGYSSIWQRIGGENDWDWGYCAGGGFVVEKMFTNTLGIHGGVWYLYSNVNMDVDVKAWAVMHAISFPLYLIVSANKGIFSFNFLTGLDVTVIADCTIETDSNDVPNKTASVLKYLSPAQFGLALGFNFKFRVAKYVDYYFGFIGDFYVSSLEQRHEGYDSYAHIYDARLITGVMFRTNLFPMKKK
jgi:hypothetical protein